MSQGDLWGEQRALGAVGGVMKLGASPAAFGLGRGCTTAPTAPTVQLFGVQQHARG